MEIINVGHWICLVWVEITWVQDPRSCSRFSSRLLTKLMQFKIKQSPYIKSTIKYIIPPHQFLEKTYVVPINSRPEFDVS